MKLKSFKGMPHELGGIDYTEGAEVEGGEYAVKIGTSGNEYIFDKESSEGDFLAKEYKKLNSNNRLLEDDPIALATFEQIAREQALTHAQRSVNEKGVDPFRNMYDEGQAKNGGVKYADGGANQYLLGGVMGGMGSMMGGPSFQMPNIEGFDIPNPSLSLEQMGEYGMTPPSYTISNNGAGNPLDSQNPNAMSYDVTPEMVRASNAQQMDMFGKSKQFSAPSAAPQQSLATDPSMTPMTMKGMEGNQLTSDLMSNPGAQMRTTNTTAQPIDSQALAELGGETTSGPNLAADQDMQKAQGMEGGFQGGDMLGAIGGLATDMLTKDSKAGQVRQQAEYRKAGDTRTRSKGTEFYKRTGKDDAASAIEGGMKGMQTGQALGPAGMAIGAVAGAIIGPMKANAKARAMQEAANDEFLDNLAGTREQEMKTQNQNNVAGNVNSGQYQDYHPSLFVKQGGAIPKNKGVYGYYANGGGRPVKKKEFKPGGVNEIDPENTIGDKGAYSLDATCVKGVNCFEDLADVKGIPDSIYNNRDLYKWLQSEEGQKLFEKVDKGGEGDIVQFSRPLADMRHPIDEAKRAASWMSKGGNPLNYPYHVGVVSGDNTYIGDGSAELPVHKKSIYNQPRELLADPIGGLSDRALEATSRRKTYYRYKDAETRRKVLESARQLEQSGTDIRRKTFGDEQPYGYYTPQINRKPKHL